MSYMIFDVQAEFKKIITELRKIVLLKEFFGLFEQQPAILVLFFVASFSQVKIF